MTRTTKGKQALLEAMLDNFSPPANNQRIVRVLKYKGSNQHEVEAGDKSIFLASIPTMFRKKVWVRRGDFILEETIKRGYKMRAKMVRILTSEHIKQFKKDKVWPQEFTDHEEETIEDDLFVDRNRLMVSEESSSNSDFSDSYSSDSDFSDDD